MTSGGIFADGTEPGVDRQKQTHGRRPPEPPVANGSGDTGCAARAVRAAEIGTFIGVLFVDSVHRQKVSSRGWEPRLTRRRTELVISEPGPDGTARAERLAEDCWKRFTQDISCFCWYDGHFLPQMALW